MSGIQPARKPAIKTESPLADAEAFAAQFAAVYGKLMVIAASVCGEPSGAADVVQDAAMIALRKRSEFLADTSFPAWMGEIVRNCALNHRKKATRRKTFAADPATLQDSAARPERRPPSPQSAKELSEWQPWFDDQVRQALAALSDDARACLLLRTVHGMSYREIADWTGLPEGTAMSHVHRGKATMRRVLANARSADKDPNPQARP